MSFFFSIIIPTYNSSKHISGSINSIIEQTFTNYEILIIDGLSKDGTCDIASEINSDKIRIISEKDNGIYDAMNKGILNAKGNWFYFLGSDDKLYDINVLSNIYKCICNTDEKVIYGNVKITNDTGWGVDGEIYAGEFNIEKLLLKNISHQAIFYNKDVFKECGNYNLKYKTCADYDFNLKVASKFNLKFIDIIIANFIGGGSSTNNRDFDFEKDYPKNVVNYFIKKIYKIKFMSFEKEILHQSAVSLSKLKILNAFYLFSIKVYFNLISFKKKAFNSIAFRIRRLFTFFI